ncbi:MAG: ASCH domain-containing protein [bacterium]|nr:ASCH domain-containing protein [bacterium]
MLFARRLWPRIADGSVTVTFRRWKRPQVRLGGTCRTPMGVLAIDAIDPVDPAGITDREARRAGFVDAAAVRHELERWEDGTVYRVAFRLVGPDPRAALRRQARLSAADWDRVAARLDRLDAACRRGPWTQHVLRLIARRPGVRAAELAESVGRETLAFKADIRKLKELGLTESLEIGYRLSPRGRALLARLDGSRGTGRRREA